MGVFSGWQSAVSSAAQILANLVGQDIVARSIRLTSTAASSIETAGEIRSTTTGASGLIFTDSNSVQRVIFGSTQYILSHSATGRLFSSGGVSGPSIALGAAAGGTLVMSSTAPTIVAGAGASIVAANGTAAFRVDLGGAASTGTITLPTATTGWVLIGMNITNPAANVIGQTGTTTTSATFTNYIRTTGVAGNWTANDNATFIAMAY